MKIRRLLSFDLDTPLGSLSASWALPNILRPSKCAVTCHQPQSHFRDLLVVEMEPLMESSGRDEEENGNDRDEEHFLLPMRRRHGRRNPHFDADDATPLPSDFVRAILPDFLQRKGRALRLWLQGPRRPEKQHIRPLQSTPRWLQDKFSIKRHALFVTVLFLIWLIFFVAVLWRRSLLPELRGYGQPHAIRCMQQAW